MKDVRPWLRWLAAWPRVTRWLCSHRPVNVATTTTKTQTVSMSPSPSKQPVCPRTLATTAHQTPTSTPSRRRWIVLCNKLALPWQSLPMEPNDCACILLIGKLGQIHRLRLLATWPSANSGIHTKSACATWPAETTWSSCPGGYMLRQCYLGQLSLWPKNFLCNQIFQTAFGQKWCFNVLTAFGQTAFGQNLCFGVLAMFDIFCPSSPRPPPPDPPPLDLPPPGPPPPDRLKFRVFFSLSRHNVLSFFPFLGSSSWCC